MGIFSWINQSRRIRLRIVGAKRLGIGQGLNFGPDKFDRNSMTFLNYHSDFLWYKISNKLCKPKYQKVPRCSFKPSFSSGESLAIWPYESTAEFVSLAYPFHDVLVKKIWHTRHSFIRQAFKLRFASIGSFWFERFPDA